MHILKNYVQIRCMLLDHNKKVKKTYFGDNLYHQSLSSEQNIKATYFYENEKYQIGFLRKSCISMNADNCVHSCSPNFKMSKS